MIKLNRTTEYGLIALRHMSKKAVDAHLTSAREVADTYGLPFEITAKTLQRLKDSGLIQSAQGSRGGYQLIRTLDSVSLGEFIGLMEGPAGVVPCVVSTSSDAPPCEYNHRCGMKDVMGVLNTRVYNFLNSIPLSELQS